MRSLTLLIAMLAALAGVCGCGSGGNGDDDSWDGSSNIYILHPTLSAPVQARRGYQIVVEIADTSGVAGPEITITFPDSWAAPDLLYVLDGSKDWMRTTPIAIPDTCPLGDYEIAASLYYDAGIRDRVHVYYRGEAAATVKVVD